MRKSLRLANKAKTNLTMEEQATQLLMKKCGVLEPDQVAEEKHHGKFRAQFVDPLQIDTVGGMREMFGLNSEGVDGPDLWAPWPWMRRIEGLPFGLCVCVFF